ncbi:MAG: hypothetical protein SGILL_000649 [Bacillariaceae sp.]
MRRIIVALDPDSETSPQEILQRFQSKFELNHVIWTDEDYMPSDFLQGDYSKVPDYLKGKRFKNKGKGGGIGSVWHRDQNVSQAEIKADLQRINHHRFRQRTFLAECYRQLKKENQKWTFHIDVDEFVTVNPLLRKMTDAKSNSISSVAVPPSPTSGSLLQFWQQVYEHHQKLIGSPVCGLMPSLSFGSREDGKTHDTKIATPFNATNFETVRWRYHGDHAPRPKSLVDVSQIPSDHMIFKEGRVFDPHIPLLRSGWKHQCYRRDIAPFNATQFGALHLQEQKAMDTVLSYPLYVNHYLGSLERFLARKDARRTVSIYREKTKDNDLFKDDDDDGGWILSWIAEFVELHGIEKVKSAL